MVGLRSKGWDRGMALDQIQLKKPEVIRSIVDTGGSFQDLLGDIRGGWKLGSIGRKRGEERAALTILPKSLFPDWLIWCRPTWNSENGCAPEWRKLLSRKSSIPRHLIPFSRSLAYRVSDRAYSKPSYFRVNIHFPAIPNDSWTNKDTCYSIVFFRCSSFDTTIIIIRISYRKELRRRRRIN